MGKEMCASSDPTNLNYFPDPKYFFSIPAAERPVQLVHISFPAKFWKTFNVHCVWIMILIHHQRKKKNADQP